MIKGVAVFLQAGGAAVHDFRQAGAPKSGPAAEQHQQQLAADALDLMAEGNLTVLEGLWLKRS